MEVSLKLIVNVLDDGLETEMKQKRHISLIPDNHVSCLRGSSLLRGNSNKLFLTQLIAQKFVFRQYVTVKFSIVPFVI